MTYVVIARDGTDDDAKSHLERTAPLVDRGEILLGGAILDEAGDMVGSVVLADFSTQEELDAWLAGDPFRPAVGAWVPRA